MKKDTFKIPLYWLELFEKLNDEEIGIIMLCVFSYHHSIAKQGELTRKLHGLSDEAVRVHDICLEDIRYQDKHRNAYKKPEDAQAIRNSREYIERRTAVYERDNYTCQNCGTIGGTLNAHHIKPFSRFPALRLDIGNGITLCKKCHRLAHGRGFRYA